MFDELTGLRNIHAALRQVNEAVQAYVAAMDTLDQKKGATIAVAALREPVNAFMGTVEMQMFDLDPDALEE